MEIGLEVDLFPEQDEAHAGDLAPECDEGGGAAKAAFAEGQVVRLPVDLPRFRGRVAVELQDPGLIQVKVDPLLDPLRKIDRFQDLVAGLHVPA